MLFMMQLFSCHGINRFLASNGNCILFRAEQGFLYVDSAQANTQEKGESNEEAIKNDNMATKNSRQLPTEDFIAGIRLMV